MPRKSVRKSVTNPTLADLQDEATWLEWRARCDQFPPIAIGRLVTSEQTRAEFLEGARLLRLDHKVRAGDGGAGPSPVQLLVADVLAAGVFLNAIFEPRRTTKTTSVQAVMLGRCRLRDDYQAGWTMCTTGAKVSERFRKDIVAPVLRLYPDPKQRPFTVNVGKGTEHIDFGNGSFLNVYTPNGDGFRSGGFDFAFADEGGEADVDLSQDITMAVLPTMDTKPGAQFVIAGTGGKVRVGNLLWDTLADPTAAVLWHGIPETTDPAAFEAWAPTVEQPAGRMRELIQAGHPGVGYTTPIEAVQRNYEKFKRSGSLDKFLLEYGGMFGTEGASDVLIPAAWWERAACDGQLPAMPRGVVAALKVHHQGQWATLAAAWEEPDDTLIDLVAQALGLDDPAPASRTRRVVRVWHHQEGTDGLVAQIRMRLRRAHAPLMYDNYGHTAVVAQELEKDRPKPVMEPTAKGAIPLAAVRLMQGLEQGTVVHYRDPDLDRAAGIAVKRAFGQYGSFSFGAPKHDPDADVTPIEAAALALHYLEQRPATTTSAADAIQY